MATGRGGALLLVTLRDLQWRRRRVGIAAVATGLLLGLTLLLGGLSESFERETDRTLSAIAADRWVVATGGAGPFTSLSALSYQRLAEIDRLPGVEHADPLV